MRKTKFFKATIRTQYVKPEMMFINGKAIKTVTVKNSVVIIDGKEHSPSEPIDVEIPIFAATKTDL